MFFKRTDNLTHNLTSYDLLKCVTVLFMFADHIGAFFIQDEMWWRVVGRLGFPAWFFLAGYSKSRAITPNLWFGAAILFFESAMFGEYLFPMNALVSFICIRIFMGHYYRIYFAGWEFLLYATIAFLILAVPTGYIFEYGTLAFLFAMFGYAVRNSEELGIGKKVRILFCATVAISVALLESVIFTFDTIQTIACVGLIGAMSVVLFNFKRAEYPSMTEKLPKPLTAIIQFGGRYTLEIYVIHLFFIKIYMFFTAPEGTFEWFSPTIFPKYM
jgi:hypothetical protein